MIFTPRPYQQIIRDFGLAHRRCNIFASPGMGKTAAGIDIFESRRLFGEAKRMLVLAPKRVAVSTWPKEVPKWHESFGHLTTAAAVGTVDERIAALRRNAHITSINYDNIAWLLEVYKDHWPFDMVLADESTRLKGLRVSLQPGKTRKDGTTGEAYLTGQGASRAKALADIAHTKIRTWINATGSPAPNGLVDLWGQQWFVDAGRRLGNSFSAFSDRWFRAVPGSDGYSKIEPLRYAQAEIEALMRECSITVDAKDWFPLEKVTEREVYIDLPNKARKVYNELEKELFAMLESGIPVEIFSAGSKLQKLLQVASGSIIYDTEARKWEALHDEKLEALKSIKEETNGENLLVAYQHKADLARILKAFPKAVYLDDKPSTVDRWNRGEIQMLVCHPASAGHGLDLQHGGRILVDYATGYNLEYDEQVIERLGPTRQYQAGYKRSVFRYRIIARDTMEEHGSLPAVQRKMSIQDSFKHAMKVRRAQG